MEVTKRSSHIGSLLVDIVSFVFTIISLYCQVFLHWILPKPRISLKGQIILITGSASGLGREICKLLATSGCKLVLWDVSSEANAATASLLRSLGCSVVYHDTVDISSRSAITSAASRVREQVGSPTILVNNAGIAPVSNFLDLAPSAIEKTIQVNLLSQFWTIQEFLPEMIALQSGHIVTIASTMSFMPMRGCAPYLASKHAVHGLIECLKDELACSGLDFIKFTTVYPFFMKTNLLQGPSQAGFKLGFRFPSITPWLEVDQVASRVVDAIQAQSEFVYLPKLTRLFINVYPYLPTKVMQAMVNFFLEELTMPERDSRQVPLRLEESQVAPGGKKKARLFVETVEKPPERIEL